MKEILILSGKGGTGKTTLASSLIEIGKVRAYADCDIDAPNLQLIRSKNMKAVEEDYYGMDKVYIDKDTCISCGTCKAYCNFNAIIIDKTEYKVDQFACESCGLCKELCPVEAIDMKENIAGKTQVYREKDIFSTARLKMGQGNSGLLVSRVKENLKDASAGKNLELAIIDGSPGIGCPVIASIAGVDMVIVVAEPSVSGMADMKRILKTCESFEVDSYVVINKCDLNLENTRKIENYCQSKSLEILGKIRFDKDIIDQNNLGKTIVDRNTKSSKEFFKIYNTIIKKYKMEV